MALKRNERYPGRFSNPNAAHPQGAFKNRTSPTSQDGSYLESDWANDWDGFFARLLTVAGTTPNGNVDTGTSSQYYDALLLAVPGRLIGPRVFTSSGTYTPTPGTKSIIVEAIGGGGASGNLTATGATENAISAAGSNGAYAKARYTSGFASVAVTIGAGGTVLGGGGGNGGDAGTTSFGSLLICPGGKGSRAGTAKTPPFNEGAAQPSAVPTGSGILISSKGPYSTWPTVVALGNGSNFANSISSPLGSYGLGGDGVVSNVSTAAQNGNAGASGCVIVWEYA